MTYSFKLPYGLRKEGEVERLIHISEILPHESGLKCNCFCPNCGARLQAKLPKTQKDFTPRFAHHNADTCDYATETAINMKAKEIIEKEKGMVIPEVIAYYENLSKGLSKKGQVTFDRVALERRLGNVIPDILAYKDDTPLMIEITVTHGIDDIKFDKIEKLGISTLEIDLSDMDRNFEPDLLYNEIIVNTENKYWVYNRVAEKGREKLKEEFLQSLKEKKEAQRKAEEREKRRERAKEEKRKGKAQRVAQLLDLNHQKKLKLKWEKEFYKDPIWIRASKRMKIKAGNIPDYINIEIPGEFVFGCDRRVWQAYIFYRYINNKIELFGENTYPISVKRIQQDIRKDFRGRLIKDLVYLGDLDEYKDLPDLTQVIYDYLKGLESFGYLIEQVAGHIYYTKFIILDPDSAYEMRFVPTSMPEYNRIEDLMKNGDWEECKKLIQELLVKYSLSKQTEYFNDLAFLFDVLVSRSKEE